MKLYFRPYSGFDKKQVFIEGTNLIVAEIEKVPISLRAYKYRLLVTLPPSDPTCTIKVGDYASTMAAERAARQLFKSKHELSNLIKKRCKEGVEEAFRLFEEDNVQV